MKSDYFYAIRGTVKPNEPLARHTTIRIGGPCDYWIEPEDVRDLKAVVTECAKEGVPLFIIGKGSNLIVRDGGFRGAAVSLNAKPFRRVTITGTSVTAGAGVLLPALIKLTCEKGLGGLEALAGIPATLGGAISMNAGGWKNPVFESIGSYVRSISVMDHTGRTRRIGRKDLVFGYKSSNLSKYIILAATLKLKKQPRDTLFNRLDGFLKIKKDKQVLDLPSAGCIFKNPETVPLTSGQLIDMMGFKGRTVGGAQISRKHANFIVNIGNASCRDVMALVEAIRETTQQQYGISLELEVKVV